MKTTFKCADCKQDKPMLGANIAGYCGGTGYAFTGGRWDKAKRRWVHARKVCYECAAERDRKYMAKRGRISLYLSKEYVEAIDAFGRYPHPVSGVLVRALPEKDGRWFYWKVSNWPGTLSFVNVGVVKGRHNIAGSRYDAWFDFGGFEWHGTQYGENTQIIHCRRTKKRSAGSKAAA